MIAAFAVAALSAALVLEPVIADASGSTVAMAVTIAYPVYDIVLIGVLVEAIAPGIAELRHGAGSQFDAAVVAAFEDALEAEAASDDLAHDLVGPAADRAQARVA